VLVACFALPFFQPAVTAPVAIDIAPPDVASLSSSDATASPASSTAPLIDLERVRPFAVAALPIVLISGVLLRLTWIAVGLIRLRSLRAHGNRGDAHADDDELHSLVGARATVRYVGSLGQPATFGVLRPVVLLPQELRDMPEGIQRAVLAHELWHVRRRDWLFTLAEEVLRAIFWFHPAMWLLISRIQAAREEVVDELSILVTGSRRNYLDALVAFADQPAVFAAAAFARRRHLVRRILLISKETVMSPKRIVMSSAATLAVLLFAGWHAVQAFPIVNQVPRDPKPRPDTREEPSRVNRTFAAQQELEILEKVKAQPNAENYMLLAIHYWERAFKGEALTPEQKAKFIDDGIAATDNALSYDHENISALTYKNILLRMKSSAETNPTERQRLLSEAETLRKRAIELQKSRPVSETYVGAPPPPPPPPPPPVRVIDGKRAVRIGGGIKVPTKVHNVNPVYPPEAQTLRVQGVVIIEATIDTTGKVRDAIVLRSIPLLDAAALDAVRQWEFTPTVVDGEPVPVIMTVTVNFTLQ
jgi:TonB family protein